MPADESTVKTPTDHVFLGNLYLFYAFDVGEEINLDKLRESGSVTSLPLVLPKYFKDYHIPLAVELPHPHATSRCISAKLYNFGAISLTYKIPFESTLEKLRKDLIGIENKFQEQSIIDAGTLFKRLKQFTTRPKFFQTKSSYLLIQVDTAALNIESTLLKELYGSVIASALRFETKMLSEYQKNEILESATGYFRGDLIVIDTEAAFIYDAEYEEILDLFEFANIQYLELRYFDRVLDNQLNILYEEESRKVPLKACIPFIGTLSSNQVDDLGKLKVDISVITERLENSIKLGGEPYFSELYALLNDKLDLTNWKETIERKLTIVHDIRSVLQHKIDSIREDILTTLIIVLIIIELLVGIMR